MTIPGLLFAESVTLKAEGGGGKRRRKSKIFSADVLKELFDWPVNQAQRKHPQDQKNMKRKHRIKEAKAADEPIPEEAIPVEVVAAEPTSEEAPEEEVAPVEEPADAEEVPAEPAAEEAPLEEAAHVEKAAPTVEAPMIEVAPVEETAPVSMKVMFDLEFKFKFFHRFLGKKLLLSPLLKRLPWRRLLQWL